VFRQNCKAVIVNNAIALQFTRIKEGTARTRRRSLVGVEEKYQLEIKITVLQQFLHHTIDDSTSLDHSHKSFVALTVDVEACPEVKELCPLYDPKDMDQIYRFILLEFDSPRRLEEFCDDLTNFYGWLNTLSQKIEQGKIDTSENAGDLCVALTEDFESNEQSPRKKKKASSASWEQPPFLEGKSDEDVLLVYPFSGSKHDMEKAADGIFSFFGPEKSTDSNDDSSTKRDSSEEESSNGRSHYLTITAGDCRRLEPGVYLNDTLIDFFMQWYVKGLDYASNE
jgi:hypothetical protein